MSLSKENKIMIDGLTRYGGLNQPNLKFIKVNVDCWEKIFDLLSLDDIAAMSQTCQRMRQIGGHYYRENFYGTTCYLRESSGLRISIVCPEVETELDRDDFFRFVDTLKICNNQLEHLRNISRMDLLGSLKTFRLCYTDLSEDHLVGLENIQTNIETVEISTCGIDDNVVGGFLASCPKLKYLRFVFVYFKSSTDKVNLFQRTFPTLEHFEYTVPREMTPELIPFLEINPSIKCLHIDHFDLQQIQWQTATTAAAAAARLDYLNIDITGTADPNELLNRLKTLHVNGFFNKLRLSIDDMCEGEDFDGETFFSGMISFNSLEVLDAGLPTYNSYTNALSQLTQLKELQLHLTYWHKDIDLEMMAMNLTNIERLRLDGTVEQLSSFLRHSKKLKVVLFDDQDVGSNALDLCNLNRVRQMSGIQRKIPIGVYEKLFLVTKWMSKGVNYDFVEITRAESIRKYFYYKRI